MLYTSQFCGVDLFVLHLIIFDLFVLHLIICSLCVEYYMWPHSNCKEGHSDITSWSHFLDLSKQPLWRTTKHDLCLNNHISDVVMHTLYTLSFNCQTLNNYMAHSTSWFGFYIFTSKCPMYNRRHTPKETMWDLPTSISIIYPTFLINKIK